MRGRTGYLESTRSGFRLRMRVPQHLQAALGRKTLLRLLGTSKARAKDLSVRVAAEFRQIIDAADRKHRLEKLQLDPLTSSAMAWREARDNEPAGERYGVGIALIDKLEDIELEEGIERAREFQSIALGEATPLEVFTPAYFQQKKMKPRQQADYARAIRKLIDFLQSKKYPPTIEGTTRRRVGEWISLQVASERHWKSINKDVSACSSYWKFLMRKGLASENPFALQSLPKEKSKTKRAWTDTELKRLLSGSPQPWLDDCIKILALSGMRANELATMRCVNCAGEWFDIVDAKTPNGIRKVFIHPALRRIVAARLKDKPPQAYLIDEIPTPLNPRIERSSAISKHFGRWRDACGLDDRVKGQRQARATLHSLRNWFISKADAAGCRRQDIERTVGHRPQGMTEHYSEGATPKQIQRVVQSVKLPS